MERQKINGNIIRQVIFISLLLFLGIVLFQAITFFLSAFMGSVTFYVLMRKRMFYLTEKKKWGHGAAAWTLMLLSFFVILVPIGLLGNILYSKVSYLVNHSNEILEYIKTSLQQLKLKTGFNALDPNSMNQVGSYLGQLLPKVLGVTLDTLTLTASMYFILYFMLTNGRKMEAALYQYIPLHKNNMHRIGNEIHRMVISNTIGIPLIALIQGIVGLAGYLIIGVHEPMLWFVATCIAALMPVVGAALIYVPLSISFFAQGDTGRGIAMAVWGFGLIGLSDNVFRLLVNKKLGNIHPLITIFGVIIGVQLFGFIGLIFGPLMISLFFLLIEIYQAEFNHKINDQYPEK